MSANKQLVISTIMWFLFGAVLIVGFYYLIMLSKNEQKQKRELQTQTANCEYI